MSHFRCDQLIIQQTENETILLIRLRLFDRRVKNFNLWKMLSTL